MKSYMSSDIVNEADSRCGDYMIYVTNQKVEKIYQCNKQMKDTVLFQMETL